MNTRTARTQAPQTVNRKSALALAFATIAGFLSLSLMGAVAGRPWLGRVGTSVAAALTDGLGLAAWVLVIELGVFSWQLFTGKLSKALPAAQAATVLVAAIVLHAFEAGGSTGTFMAHVLSGRVGGLGTVLAVILLTGVLVRVRVGKPWSPWVRMTLKRGITRIGFWRLGNRKHVSKGPHTFGAPGIEPLTAPAPAATPTTTKAPDFGKLDAGPAGLAALLASPPWTEFAASAALPVAVGRDEAEAPVFMDLAAAPHVLIAGATGSGKSVGLNAMLLSLLSARSPAQVKLVLIDPKMVELAAYEGLGHLHEPVITETDQAASALARLSTEMERRYRVFRNTGARNIASYNQLGAPLPYLVVVVEEYADLVLENRKVIEPLIQRLAQKARAAGIHVILTTQRPSVDVVTGVIKANFPTRIAFKVVQREDSKTVLGDYGAEKLPGKGSMLLATGADAARRVQGVFVSPEETDRVLG